MTLLDDLIAGAVDDTVTTANLLRQVIVVSHRMQASEVQRWAESELNGYSESPLPSYRGPLSASVRGLYSGPSGSRQAQTLSQRGVPSATFVEDQFYVNLNQPLAELETAVQAEGEMGIPWAGHDVVQWNRWEDDEKVPRITYMSLFSATTIITKMSLSGVIDAVRNKALILALDLQANYPNAGEQDGPTVAQPEVRSVITNVTNNIYGDGANLSVGDRNVQTATVQQGDLDALLDTLSDLGLGEADLGEFKDIVSGDDNPSAKAAMAAAYADRIRNGSILLPEGVTADSAADKLLESTGLFLGTP